MIFGAFNQSIILNKYISPSCDPFAIPRGIWRGLHYRHDEALSRRCGQARGRRGCLALHGDWQRHLISKGREGKKYVRGDEYDQSMQKVEGKKGHRRENYMYFRVI